MQKVGLLLAVVLFVTVSAAAQAQPAPRVELFGGYSHAFADVNDSTLNMDGFHISAAENLNSWAGGVLDFSSHYANVGGVNVNFQSIMYGPRFAYRKSGALTPSVHALFGAVRGSAGYLGISKSDTHFGMGFGGELDLKINKWAAFRLVQADYLATRFVNLRQDNVRLSTGIVFRFPQ